jgi:Bacterial Ig-like domain (group 2)
MKHSFALSIATLAILSACGGNDPIVNVGNGTISSILLICNPISIVVATNSQCTATAKNSSGVALSTQPAFSFTSSDKTKATVSSTGLVTGVAVGSTIIKASSGGVESNAAPIGVSAKGGSGTAGMIIVPPAAAGTNVQLEVIGINNAGHVLYKTLGLDLPNPAPNKVWLYNGSSSQELTFPGLNSVELGAGDGCLTNDDAAFIRYRINDISLLNPFVVGFWNGSSGSKVLQLPTAGNGFPEHGRIKGCNDDKLVAIYNLANGDNRWVKTWKPGDANVTTFDEDGNNNFGAGYASGVSSSRAFLTRQNKVFGVRNGTTWTARSPDPIASNPFITQCCFIQKDGTVVSSDATNLMIWPAPQTGAVSTIVFPSGLAGAGSIYATNTTGRMLFTKSAVTPPETWVYSSGAFEKLAPTTASDYPAFRSLAINDSGLVAMSGKNSDNPPKTVIELVQAK